MIERNLEQLKPEEQAVRQAASVAGAEFSAVAVAAALERPQNEIEAHGRPIGFLACTAVSVDCEAYALSRK